MTRSDFAVPDSHLLNEVAPQDIKRPHLVNISMPHNQGFINNKFFC